MIFLLGALFAGAAGVPAANAIAPLPATMQPPTVQSTPVQATPAVRLPAANRPTRAQILSAVRSEWPRYDAGAKGRLTPLEFSTWVMRSHGGTVAPRAHAGGIAPVSAMNASATAFSRADANHDGGVTPDEMTNFLMLPPRPTATERAKLAAAKPSVVPIKAPLAPIKATPVVAPVAPSTAVGR